MMSNLCQILISKKVEKVKELPFKKLDQIGKGTYGIVYKGKYDNKVVAIKEVQLSHKNIKIDELLNEVKILKCLPNKCTEYVVYTYDIILDTNCDKLYFIMEYMPNGDLISLTKRNYDDAMKTLINGWNHCLKGLKCIHKNGIVHKDIKPENILVSNNDEFKFADFGLSCITKCHKPFSGSLAYLDPHVIYNGHSKGFLNFQDYMNADYWALGMTFLHLIFTLPPLIQNLYDDDEIVVFDYWTFLNDTDKSLSEFIQDLYVNNHKIIFNDILSALPNEQMMKAEYNKLGPKFSKMIKEIDGIL